MANGKNNANGITINKDGSISFDSTTYTWNGTQYVDSENKTIDDAIDRNNSGIKGSGAWHLWNRKNNVGNAISSSESLKSLVDKGAVGEIDVTAGERIEGVGAGNDAKGRSFKVGDDYYVLDGEGNASNFINNEDYIGAGQVYTFHYGDKDYSLDWSDKKNGEVGLNRNVHAILAYFEKYGEMPTDKNQLDIGGAGNYSKAYSEAVKLLQDAGIYEKYQQDYANANGDTSSITNTASSLGEEDAYNQYWNELYSRNKGTLGGDAYDALYQSELNSGQNAIDLANAQTQQLGLAQAATVKSIVDQVRNERMAQLRAGMSESQIANQDMQTMLSNTSALNQSIAESNLAKLQGQQQMDNAQNTAYQNWLTQMNTAASSASAFAAADAGDIDNVTRKIMNQTGMTYTQALKYAQGKGNES